MRMSGWQIAILMILVLGVASLAYFETGNANNTEMILLRPTPTPSSIDIYALLQFLDNPDTPISVDEISLLLPTDREPDVLPNGSTTLCSYGIYCRQIIIGIPPGQLSNSLEGEIVVGNSAAVQMELSNAALDIMTNYAVEVEALTVAERDEVLRAFLEADNRPFGIELVVNDVADDTSRLALTAITYSTNGMSKQFLYQGHVYSINYGFPPADSTLFQVVPLVAARHGTADEYYQFRFYLADTMHGHTLESLAAGQQMMNIDYRLLLNETTRKQIAERVGLPEQVLSLIAEDLDNTMHDPFDLRAYVPEVTIDVIRDFYGLDE